MDERRWHPGHRIDLDGVQYRVERGAKGPRDLRLDHFAGERWRPVHMSQGALLADFFFENEEVLYPPPHYKGGRKYLSYLQQAARYGWDKADAILRLEQAQKKAQATAQPSLFDDFGDPDESA